MTSGVGSDPRRRRSRPPAAQRRHLVALPALAFALLLGAAAAAGPSEHGTGVRTAAPDPGQGGSPPRAQAAFPEDYFDLEGGAPAAFPTTRTAVGFLALGGSLRSAVEVLGPPESTFPDLEGQAHRWRLAGAELVVTGWSDADEIAAVSVQVPPGSPARVAAFGGVVIGRSTVDDVVRAWGDGQEARSPYDDYAVQYVECAGSQPIVVKFDGASGAPGAPGAPGGDEAGGATVRRALVAFADEPPGSNGCGP